MSKPNKTDDREKEKYFENITSEKTGEKWNGWFKIIFSKIKWYCKSRFFYGGGVKFFEISDGFFVGVSKITTLFIYM